MSVRRNAPMTLSSQGAWVRASISHVHRCARCGVYELCVFDCVRAPSLASVAGLPQGVTEPCVTCRELRP